MSDCKAVQYSDQMLCECGNVWDMNDPAPPECQSKRRNGVRAQDKKRVESFWHIGVNAEDTAKHLNLPLDEVQTIFKKLKKRLVEKVSEGVRQ